MQRGRIYKRMYAVSLEGVGLIAGTMAYSRRNAIEHFLCGVKNTNWEGFKRAGYRTVLAKVLTRLLPFQRRRAPIFPGGRVVQFPKVVERQRFPLVLQP